MDELAKLDIPFRVAAKLVIAMVMGNFTIVREKTAAAFGGCCAGHGGIDYCGGSICVCVDGHVCIKAS